MVAAVDEPSEPGHAVDGEGPRRPGVDGHGDEAVAHDEGPVGLSRRMSTVTRGATGTHGLEGGASRTRAPRCRPHQDAPHRRLVDEDAHHRVGAGAQPGVEVLLDRGDRDVEALLAPEGDGDVDPGLVLLDTDALDPGVGVDLAAVGQHAEDGAHGGGVEGERPQSPGDAEGPGLLGQGLGAVGDVLARHDELHHPAAGTGRGVGHDGAGIGERSRERRQRLGAQPLGDAGGLGVAHEHGVDDLVHRARTRRVVGGVAHHLAPRQRQQGGGPALGRLEQRPQRLGQALRGALGPGRSEPSSTHPPGSTPRP